MSSNRLLRAVLLGDFAPPEFQAARELLSRDSIVTEVSQADCPLHGVMDAAAPELVVVAQARPRQWDGPWLSDLRQACPLARIVAVLGSWCEGETRTGAPLDADIRVFWHCFGAWWNRQMECIAQGRSAQWSSPGSSGSLGWTRELPGRAAAGTDARESRGLVLIAAGDRDTADSLALVCQTGGWASVWVRAPAVLPVVRGAAALVYDGGQLDDREIAAIDRLREVYGPLPVVALADFPTIDRVMAARSIGVGRVLGKPFDLENFLAVLRIESRVPNEESQALK